MRPLVAVRNATAYDPRFLSRSPVLWPLRRAALRLASHDDFPRPSALDRVFEGAPPVRFVPSTPRARRHRRAPLDAATLYDGRITLERVVPTRERSWHDLINALVWGTFPNAKLALHARQHRAIAERLGPGALTLPPTRTREQDALALVDEGGVVFLARDVAEVADALRGPPGAVRRLIEGDAAHGVVFGHAVFESVVLGVAPAAVAAVVLAKGASGGNLLREVDAALAEALRDAGLFRGPEEMRRVDVLEELES